MTNPLGSTTQPDGETTLADIPATQPETPATQPDTPATQPDTPASPPDTPASPPEPDGGVYALLIDGTTVLIRPARCQDQDAVRQMHAEMSPGNIYLRFFSASPHAAGREAKRVCRPADSEHEALLAWLGSQLVGVASYEPTGKPGVAEIAFAVSDHMHGRGVATLLLDHLVSVARLRGLRAFTAATLADNVAMLGIFANVGLPARRQLDGGVIETTFPLPADEADQRLQGYLDSVAKREQVADVASLRYLLEPSSIAVVGVSRKPGRVGSALLRNILAGGFAGRVYPVNPLATSVEGIPCLPTVADLPEPVDVAVIAVPPAAVAGVAQECGRRGVRSLVVITSWLDAGAGSELLAVCRRYGMRLVGPNCFGIAVPSLGLNATFAAAAAPPGVAGLVVQSGGIGMAVLEHLSRLGIGVSSFASVGDKYDVSSNDMLLWWEHDAVTRLAVLYLESFGSPRRFAQTARRLGRKIPVLTVIGGRSVAGQRAAASHAAAAVTPLITQEALFEQAGIVATTSLGELIDVAALLACQPLLTGNRIAIVSNAGEAGVLAADACADNGLAVAALSAATQQRLRQILPAGAAISGPVDTTAAASQDVFRTCLDYVARDDEVDAVLAITVPTALCDLTPAILRANVTKPLVAAMLGQQESVRLLRRLPGPARPTADEPVGAVAGATAADTTAADTTGADTTAADTTAADTTASPPPVDAVSTATHNLLSQSIPVYLYPESAARALGHAARYGAWRSRTPGSIPQLTGLKPDDARTIVARFLGSRRLGGWLSPAETSELLSCYGILLTPARQVTDAAAATTTTASATAADRGGVEVMIGLRHEPVFGPVVVFGLGGVATDVFADRAARLAPLTDSDADELIRGIRAAPLLLGHHGMPPADLGALAGLLLRVSRLADELPEIAELDLSPVIARTDGIDPVEGRIRLVPATPQDPFLRRLR